MILKNEVLAATVRNRLCACNRIPALAIDISALDGCVSVQGCVDTQEQRETLLHVVSGMIGVRSVCCENLMVRR
jgi:osmotically-inducible protein OsmY